MTEPSVEKMLETARKRYTRALEVEQKNRDHALECLKFRNLEQWNPEVKNMREKDPEGARPCLVVDKTNQYLNQVINDYRQNKPAIKVRPIDDKGDPEVAEVFQGIIRHIEDMSGADLAYETAYEAAVDGGFGYFRVLTEYCDEMSFDQDIRIKRIKNRFQVVLDPDIQEPDGSDAKWGMILEKVQREDFKRDYPNADEMDFASDGKVFTQWVFKDYVIVAEYFRIEPRKATICLYSDGNSYEKGKAPLEAGYPVLKAGKPVERETTINAVKWSKMTAKEEIDKRDWPGKFIPIAKVVGTELDIEGETHTSGLLKGAMEPQKIHNYAASSFIETVQLAPRAQWVAAEAQIEGYEELYRTANRRAITVLPYKPVLLDGNVQVPPPQRINPAGIPVGWMQAMQNTEHDIQSSMGMYSETVLGTGNANSGKQEALQQRRGDTATFHYSDNASRAIRYCGRILIDLIPKIYDTERVARILGEDGTADHASLNPEQPVAVQEIKDEAGAIKKIYNLGVGKYDVTVTTGPSFTTKRQEAVEWQTQVITAQPELMKVGGDILFRNMDAPGADEWAKRLKKLLPPELQDEEENSEVIQTPQGPMPVAQVPAVLAQLSSQLEMAVNGLEQAKLLEKQNKAEELRIKQFEAESDRIRAESEKLKATSEVAQSNAMLTEIANAAAAQAVNELLNANVIVRQ